MCICDIGCLSQTTDAYLLWLILQLIFTSDTIVFDVLVQTEKEQCVWLTYDASDPDQNLPEAAVLGGHDELGR